jgi:hypothetical protein
MLSIKLGSRMLLLAVGLVAAAAGGCADDTATTRTESSTVCCECGCGRSGTPCLAVTIESDDIADCPALCEARCAAEEDCPSMFESASCEPEPEGEPWRPNGEQNQHCVDNCEDDENPPDSPPPR